MLILLEKGISDLNDSSDDFLQAIEQLSAISRNGFHFVLGYPQDLRALAMLPGLSLLTQKHFCDLEKVSRSALPHLPQQLAFYVSVNSYGGKILKQCNDHAIFSADLTEFKDCSWVSKSCLLGENTIDCDIFHIIAKAYMHCKFIGESTSPLSRVAMLAFEYCNGGGSVIDAEYSRYQKENKNICCIKDSDFLEPSQNIKQYSAKTHCYFTGKKVSAYLKLHVHEIENLLPLALLRDAAGNSVAEKNFLFFLSKCDDDGKKDVLAYIDLKKGIRKKPLRKISPEFTQKIMNSLQSAGYASESVWDCLDGECQSCPKDNCIVLSGLGESILEKTLPVLLRYPERQLYSSINDYVREKLDSIMDIIVSFGVVNARRT